MEREIEREKMKKKSQKGRKREKITDGLTDIKFSIYSSSHEIKKRKN